MIDTVENAVAYLQHHNTPYWWVKSGTTKIGECVDTEDMTASIAQFRTASTLWPSGSYKLECSDKPQNRSGSFTFPFTKGQSAATAQAMPPVATNNVFGVPDATYAHLQSQFEQAFIMRQMYEFYRTFEKEWPEYKKKIDAMHTFLKDDDGDGTPDILENVKKGTEMVKTVSELGSVFKNVGKLNL